MQTRVPEAGGALGLGLASRGYVGRGTPREGLRDLCACLRTASRRWWRTPEDPWGGGVEVRHGRYV
jgi:hypothetical protein